MSMNAEIKNDVFKEGKAEHAAQFTESLKAIVGYIRRSELREAGRLAQALKDEVTPTIHPPGRPAQIEDPNNEGVMIDDAVELQIWAEEIKMVAKSRRELRQGLERVYAILWEQCSPSVQGRLKGEAGFQVVDDAKDPIQLLQCIKGICCGYDAHKQSVYANVQAIKLLSCTSKVIANQMKTTRRNLNHSGAS